MENLNLVHDDKVRYDFVCVRGRERERERGRERERERGGEHVFVLCLVFSIVF